MWFIELAKSESKPPKKDFSPRILTTSETSSYGHAALKARPKPFNWEADWTSRLFKLYLEKAGIKRDLHLYCLRPTAATDLVRAGIHPNKIKEFLGHSSLKVTEIYTHVLPEDLHEAAEALTCLG